MAQASRFFEGVTFSESDLAEPLGDMCSDGVFFGRDNQLAVSAPGGMVVNVATGRAMIQGFWYKNDAVVGLAIAANGAGANRIDRVVLRLDRAANTVVLAIRQGVAGAGNPAMSRAVGGAWELCLGIITVTPGASNITAGNVQDVRDYYAECGWAGESFFRGLVTPFNVGGAGSGATIQIGLAYGVVSLGVTAGGTLSLGSASSIINAYKINYLCGVNGVADAFRFFNAALTPCAGIYANADQSTVITSPGSIPVITITATGLVRIGAATIGSAALFHIKQAGTGPLDSLRIERATSSESAGGHFNAGGDFIVYSGAQTMTFVAAGTSVAFSGNISVTGSISAGPGTFTGVITAPGMNSSGHIFPTQSVSYLLGSGGLRWLGASIGCLNLDANGLFPEQDNARQLGNASSRWLHIYAMEGYKPAGGSWVASSDDRLKDHSKFRPYKIGLDTVLKLEPVHYRYNGEYNMPTDREFVGFRAQELQKIAPSMVGSHLMRRDADDPDSEDEMLTVDTSDLPFMLINAIKDLQAQINALRDRKN